MFHYVGFPPFLLSQRKTENELLLLLVMLELLLLLLSLVLLLSSFPFSLPA